MLLAIEEGVEEGAVRRLLGVVLVERKRMLVLAVH